VREDGHCWRDRPIEGGLGREREENKLAETGWRGRREGGRGRNAE